MISSTLSTKMGN